MARQSEKIDSMMIADVLDDGDSALLSELLVLIAGGTHTEHLADETAAEDAKPPRQTARQSAKEPTGRKREIAFLRNEAQQLTEQLRRLRDAQSHAIHHTLSKERAISERHKRQRAENECTALREAVFQQKQFIRGLRSVFSATQRLSLDLDLCRYLHRDTRLSLDRTDRWGAFHARSHDARVDSAIDVLCRETSSVSLAETAATPFVHCELIDDVNTRSTTYTAVYTIDTTDVAAVVRAVCVAIRDVGTICPSGHLLHVTHDVVDMDAPSDANMLYRVMRVAHQCAATGEAIEVASRMVTTYSLTPDIGVVKWDFVDADERHPTTDTVNVTRETTGACLVRCERGDDGVERVVFRSIGTKKFRFHNAQSVHKHGRIACIVQADAMVRGDELLFRRLVLDQIAAEQAIDAPVHVAQV